MTERGVRAFKRWMRDNGIEYSDSLQLCIGQGSVSGIGVRALGDLKVGDIIATIPKKACFTIGTSALSHMIEEAELGGALGLVVALMYERSKGTNSPWYAYLHLLPHQECVPLVWTADEVDTLLAGTELHKASNPKVKSLLNTTYNYYYRK
jgi:SET domain-containing protein 6